MDITVANMHECKEQVVPYYYHSTEFAFFSADYLATKVTDICYIYKVQSILNFRLKLHSFQFL